MAIKYKRHYIQYISLLILANKNIVDGFGDLLAALDKKLPLICLRKHMIAMTVSTAIKLHFCH